MKIRTDFVTNSSSSNYSIEIKITSKSGEEVDLQLGELGGGDDLDGNGTVEITPNENEIRSAKSILELYYLLINSVTVDGQGLDPFGFGHSNVNLRDHLAQYKIIKKDSSIDKLWPELYDEEGKEVSHLESYKAKLDNFLHNILLKIPSISDIKTVSITQAHQAGGALFDSSVFWLEFYGFLDFKGNESIKEAFNKTIANHEDYADCIDEMIDNENICLNYDGWKEMELTTSFDLETGETTKTINI